jgi:hypothetical protein
MRAGLLVLVPTIMLLVVSGCQATDEAESVFKSPLGPYGEAYAYPAGSTLTDGNTILELTDGPVRILSISFQDAGQKPKLLAVRIRPLSATAIPFDSEPTFPPPPSVLAGSAVASGAVLNGPERGQPFSGYELIVGYRMPLAGRYVRTSVTIRYEFKKHIMTLFHPSWIALCVGTSGKTPCPSPHE